MKKTILKPIVGLAFVAFLLSSCDDLEKLDDITFSATFALPDLLLVDESADAPDNPYVGAVSTLMIEQDPDIEKYKEKIEKITVKEVRYVISEFVSDEPVTLEEAEVRFYATGSSPTSGVIAQVENVVLENGSGVLQINSDALNTIGKTLKDEGEISVVAAGAISAAPVSFQLSVELDVEVTAGALK